MCSRSGQCARHESGFLTVNAERVSEAADPFSGRDTGLIRGATSVRAGDVPAGVGEAELLAAARAGDREAFGVLFGRHGAGALSFARSLVRNHHDAQDVLHEAFYTVIRAVDNGRGPHLSFPAYLMTAVRSTAAGHRIKAAKELPVDPAELMAFQLPGHGDEFERALGSDAGEQVRAALMSLPLSWREILLYGDVLGLPPRRVGPLMGISPNDASALLRRARTALRTAYQCANL